MATLARSPKTSMKHTELKLLDHHRQEGLLIESALNEAWRGVGAPVRILEAGCGRRWDLLGLDFPYHLTGIDLDAEALRLRLEHAKDLDEGIRGDLLSATFDDGRFDIVYSSYVLEHVHGAREILDKFVDWVRPGGFIILRVPDGRSAYGTITTFSPHWFHVLYYRWILGHKTAGQPGFPPYPTAFDEVVSAVGIRDYAVAKGLEVVSAARTRVETKPGMRGAAVRAAMGVVKVMTLARRSDQHCTLTFVLRRPAGEA